MNELKTRYLHAMEYNFEYKSLNVWNWILSTTSALNQLVIDLHI